MRAFLFYTCFIILLPGLLSAQDDDKNVVIESKTQEFSFSRNGKNNSVEIREKYSQRYRCTLVRTEILFSEMYDENESIEDVEIRVDGKKSKWITPSYEYYSVENIFYSDAKVCYFKLPFEKKDSYNEVTLVKTYKDPRYFTNVYFHENYFTEHKTVTFIIPRWMKLQIMEYNLEGSPVSKTSTYDEKQGADIVTYTINNMNPYKDEPATPGSSYIHPHLLVMCKEAETSEGKQVFFNSLADQYKWYHQLVMNIGDDQQVLLQKVNELTANLSGDIEKIKSLFNWVQHNIRYIAFEDGIAGFKPAKAQDVMNKKYGDCKGMANLTRGLLKAAGFDARLCWIGTNHIAYDYSTPSLAVDNHMICALIYKGKKYFLDATETNIGFDEYAERIQGRQVLIEDGNNYLLEKVPSITPEQNTQTEKNTLAFDGAENIKGKVSIQFKGEARSDLLSKIQATKKDNLQTALENYLAENNRNYEISDLHTGELLGTDSILTISYNMVHKNAASAFGKEIYLEADFRKEMDGFTIDTAKRRYDVMLPLRMNLVTETSILVPQGFKVSQLPPNKEWKLPNMSITLAFSQKGETISYKKNIRISDVRLKKKSFAEWNRVIKELGSQYREQLIFVKQ